MWPGADPYYGGSVRRTVADVRRPDGARPPGASGRRCTQRIPVAIVLAGGYAQSVEDTITIHANTAAVAKEIVEKVSGGRWHA